MKKSFLLWLGIVVLFAGVANAQFVLPNSKKFSASIINNLPQCNSPTLPDDFSGNFGCLYTGPVTPCQLTDTGQGSLLLQKTGSASKGTQDVLVKLSLKGLNAACEGLELHPIIKVRVGGSRCNGGQDCVITDTTTILNNGAGGCLVANGKCMMKASLNALSPNIYPSNRNSTIQILECGIREASAFNNSLACGSTLE